MDNDDAPSVTSIESSTDLDPTFGNSAQAKYQEKQLFCDEIRSSNDISVYIPDIPTNISQNSLEEIIQNCLEEKQQIKISDIQCYLNLGVALVKVMNQEDRKHLIDKVQSMTLDDENNTIISFVNELDIDSYIVIDKKTLKLPSANEVSRLYMDITKTEESYLCESISIQYPNIFRISFNTIDELVQAANQTYFKIGDSLAIVYPRVDCSFFEDLPSNTNDEQISSAIAQQIGENELLPISFYVQFNKETGNAVVLGTKLNKKWIAENFLKINGKNISKKAKLAYRIVVSPIPRDFDTNQIINHTLFANRIVAHNHIKDHLIIELDDMKCYENCLSIGALRIGKHTMNIIPHTVVSDPDKTEITVENWYGTQMLDIKPDIMTIIDDHQHPILNNKWNSQIWIEQMINAQLRHSKSEKYSHDRHLLRITVMLNTIGIVRKKKYIVDDEEIILKSETMKTIEYDHKSKLSYEKTIDETNIEIPYSSTNVMVLNKDCLVLYEELVGKGYNPLLLNMANATNPGGGYRKGDGAQEENLFRRSDYYQSLDVEVADEDRSEQFYCTDGCQIKRKTNYESYYPMNEFGAIYTSGITVFRQTEDNGYALMKNPLYNVCSIAMAAYRNPDINKENKLIDKYAINTRKKIENIFAIGYHQKHDCLILSAFGCGAFKNPPEHIALLFKSVIYQYAGFFKTIYFAIVDDHNTGSKINPQGNLAPFNNILDGLIVEPQKKLHKDGIIGPNRIIDKTSDGKLILSDCCILDRLPCRHGSQCNQIKNDQHCHTFSHPPMCSYQKSDSSCDQMNDPVHLFTFLHRNICQYGGACDNMNNTHLNEYYHPDYCQQKHHCHNVTKQHLFDYRHLPVCTHGPICSKYLKEDSNHCQLFRHCKIICPYDNGCVNFHDKEHFNKTIHSFREPCPFTPYNCSMYIEFIQNGDKKTISQEIDRHCHQYSHVCLYGRQCKTKNNQHFRTTIHIARKLCSDLDKCSNFTEIHLESYSHPNIRDIRLFCRHPGYQCRHRFEKEHLKAYRHGENHDHLGVIPPNNFNLYINFVHNQGQLIRAVNKYVDSHKWKKSKISPEILNWIRALQPVHRCQPHIFESILVLGNVMSRNYMHLLKQPKYVCKAVKQHSRVRLLFLKFNNPTIKENISKLIRVLVDAEFAKLGSGGVASLDTEIGSTVKIIERQLKPPLSDHDIGIIHEWTNKITNASIELHKNPKGIGYSVDQSLGTDKHVFSILGPHLGYYYGDIVIIFKSEIMLHPDANFTIQAATSFGPSGNAYKHRPWLTDPGDQKQRIEHFHNSKLHCSIPRYEYSAATELIALTGKNKESMDVNLQDIMKHWINVDSHEVFEGHLPQLIPLDYIDYIYMPNNVFQSLTPEVQRSAKAVFKDKLILTNHNVDLSVSTMGNSISLDSTRQSYKKYIADQLIEKIKERTNKPQTSHGIVMTIPSSRFEEYIILPITISQSYELYCLDKNQPLNTVESTYIYWETMNGDMMLTISNKTINPKEEQSHLRCLVCYVAENPSTNRDDYHEEYSYLDDNLPFQHYANVHTSKFKSKSNLFYRGCNTNNFLTFCLQINHKKGVATLLHAGPNGIYNHEKIQYQFNKSDLDLSRIDFIHVSAGNQDVPIRNFKIAHEPILELHPTFDKDFKIDTSTSLSERRASYSDNDAAAARIVDEPSHDTIPKPRVQQVQPSTQLPTKTEKVSFFTRIKNALLGPSTNDNTSKMYPPTSQSSSQVSSHTNSSRETLSKLPPCRDSVYCLNQNVRDHTRKYSHPCRFNELCWKKDSEPHLVHQVHNVPKCSSDGNCSKRKDPVHRAQYRHTNFPDYLIPCRHQESCYDTTDEHRIKYFHGEQLPSIKKNKVSTGASSGNAAKGNLIPCRYGDQCRSMKNSEHTRKYSHPS